MQAKFKSQLSEREIKVFEQLSTLNSNSLWGLAITNVCADPDTYRFRDLVCQLKSQGNDNEEVMRCILGPVYEPVMAL